MARFHVNSRRAGTLLAGAIGLALVAATPARALDTIRVGTPDPNAVGMGLISVGEQEGIFAKFGVHVERVDFGGSAKLHAAMASGALDVAMGSGSDLLFIIRGVPEKAVGVLQTLPNDLAFIARPDLAAKGLAGLKGRKIGVSGPGGLTQWLAMQASVTQGWGPQGAQYVALGTNSTMSAALVSGNVDAIVSSDAVGYELESLGKARVIATGGAVSGNVVAHLIFATQAVMRDKESLLRAYLKGWYATAAYVKAHKAETVAIMAPRVGISPEIYAKVYDQIAPVLTLDGHFSDAAFAATAQSLVDMGQVKPTDIGRRADFVTEQFLP